MIEDWSIQDYSKDQANLTLNQVSFGQQLNKLHDKELGIQFILATNSVNQLLLKTKEQAKSVTIFGMRFIQACTLHINSNEVL